MPNAIIAGLHLGARRASGNDLIPQSVWESCP
jgi:hypothetical protein